MDWLREHLPDAILGAVAGEVLHRLVKWAGSLRERPPKRAGKHFKRG